MPSIRHAPVLTPWPALLVALGVALAACNSTSPTAGAADNAEPTSATDTVAVPSADVKGAAASQSGAPPARQAQVVPVVRVSDIAGPVDRLRSRLDRR